ncbi:MAG: serine/threonine-protein kinase, partial [Myxococcota bacterium]
MLGRGGFGTVYHARLEGSDGFMKDVAIKLLTDPDPPAETLTRFRDEARILGRLRDRAIVNVDPPTKLDGRWAIVMEYVDGSDCRRLLREHGRLPAKVALGIVEEVASTLANLWSHPGEDGQPMRLLHRDIKPSNIQVTPTGAVKLLDFGIARAEFGWRETTTTSHLAGTVEYLPMERVRGIEDPRGDVYSLGVVLEQIVTGVPPAKFGQPPQGGIPRDVPVEVLRLARDMQTADYLARPTADEVEARAKALAVQLDGPTLREWSRDNVNRKPLRPGPDPLIGHTLSETFARLAFTPPPPPPRRNSLVAGMLLVSVAALSLTSVLIVVGTLLGFGWFWAQHEQLTGNPAMVPGAVPVVVPGLVQEPLPAPPIAAPVP